MVCHTQPGFATINLSTYQPHIKFLHPPVYKDIMTSNAKCRKCGG